MHLRHAAHVVVHGEILGGLEHVGFGFHVITSRLEVEAEVKVGVAAVVA